LCAFKYLCDFAYTHDDVLFAGQFDLADAFCDCSKYPSPLSETASRANSATMTAHRHLTVNGHSLVAQFSPNQHSKAP
jgi:hypothetical protein